MMENIEWLDKIIENLRKIAKPDDRPVAYIKGNNGKVSVILFAIPKEEMKIGLYTLMKTTNAKEIILIINAWTVKTNIEDPNKLKIQPSTHPKRKEAFVINYFSEKTAVCHCLYYKVEKNKIVWVGERSYKDSGELETQFNPFKIKKEELDKIMLEIESKEIKEKGKKQIIPLEYKHQMIIYRHNGKAFLEVWHNKNIFFKTAPTEDNLKFENNIKEFVRMAELIGKSLQGEKI
jgi:hypothetical protein